MEKQSGGIAPHSKEDLMTPDPARKRVLLEVAIASVEDAQAEVGGMTAWRLNAALSLGGLTPSLAPSSSSPRDQASFVMLHPRPALCYSPAEFRVLGVTSASSQSCADGIVFGILAKTRRSIAIAAANRASC